MLPRQRLGALRSLCLALQGQIDVGTGEPRQPRWSQAIRWADIIDLATELWVEPVLWWALRDVRATLVPDVASQLLDLHVINTRRNLQLRHQLVEAVSALNDADVVPLLFKGGLQLVDGTWKARGSRGMVDLDLIIPGERMDRAVEALRAVGYAPAPGKPFLHPHELPMVRKRSPGPLELHCELGSDPIPAVLSAQEAWEASSPLHVHGMKARALSPTHQVLHSILHSAIQDLDHAVAALPLRQLLTLTQLAGRPDTVIEWQQITRRARAHGLDAVLREHLWLAYRCTGLDLPSGALPGVHAYRHEVRVLASFALRWPADMKRNLRHAFAEDYMRAMYAEQGRASSVNAMRARHAARLVRDDGLAALRPLLRRNV